MGYIETTTGSLPEHKFEEWAGASRAPIAVLASNDGLRYVAKVYVDDFISAIIPTTREQVTHVA